ncbi:hypothetical protein GGI21_002716, partial [Coemansia aciculifera]
VNRNPFAAADGMGGGMMNASSNKQPSMNQLMTGGMGNQMAMGGTVGSANVFGQLQQQQTPGMFGGGMQQAQQTQQMAFQQQNQNQQVNPFAQNNNNNMFGL